MIDNELLSSTGMKIAMAILIIWIGVITLLILTDNRKEELNLEVPGFVREFSCLQTYPDTDICIAGFYVYVEENYYREVNKNGQETIQSNEQS